MRGPHFGEPPCHEQSILGGLGLFLKNLRGLQIDPLKYGKIRNVCEDPSWDALLGPCAAKSEENETKNWSGFVHIGIKSFFRPSVFLVIEFSTIYLSFLDPVVRHNFELWNWRYLINDIISWMICRDLSTRVQRYSTIQRNNFIHFLNWKYQRTVYNYIFVN